MLDNLRVFARKQGFTTSVTQSYEGKSDLLVLYGVGHVDRAPVRTKHLESGRNVILWDVGYFGRKKIAGFLRCSINHDHPQAFLSLTPSKPTRWAFHGIPLRNDYNDKGPIILVGLGPKTRVYLPELENWELNKLRDLRRAYPNRRIIYRPKPRRVHPKLTIETDAASPIEDILRGASLVVCRHSNVAIDACIAGIPFETDDGAAYWLRGKEYTPQVRLDFLQRLAWWQWHKTEADEAWLFLMHIFNKLGVDYGH